MTEPWYENWKQAIIENAEVNGLLECVYSENPQIALKKSDDKIINPD